RLWSAGNMRGPQREPQGASSVSDRTYFPRAKLGRYDSLPDKRVSPASFGVRMHRCQCALLGLVSRLCCGCPLRSGSDPCVVRSLPCCVAWRSFFGNIDHGCEESYRPDPRWYFRIAASNSDTSNLVFGRGFVAVPGTN